MRGRAVACVGALATAAVLADAFYKKRQFYPAVVYLTGSGRSMTVLYAQAVALFIYLFEILKGLFFGVLTAAEAERLSENLWVSATETLVALAVFRAEFTPLSGAGFAALIFTKSFHLLVTDRAEAVERVPVLPPLFHVRAATLFAVLLATDVACVLAAYGSVKRNGISVNLVFGFEFAVMCVTLFSVLIRYLLSMAEKFDLATAETKSAVLVYWEAVLALVKTLLFAALLWATAVAGYWPLFALRRMFTAAKELKMKSKSAILWRRAVRRLETVYTQGTPEEIAEAGVCIVCREDLNTGSKKLPCGHLFHAHCLRAWFQRQQCCPTCRLDVLSPPRQAAPEVPPVRPTPEPPDPAQGLNRATALVEAAAVILRRHASSATVTPPQTPPPAEQKPRTRPPSNGT